MKICVAAIVFLISVIVLGYDIERMDIAERYVDPINHIRAQDESLHVHAAKRMTQDSDWFTPKVMGRLFLFKPPLLLWLTAASVKFLGVSLFSIRLPNLIFGAGGVVAIFLWIARGRSIPDGILASGLLLFSPFWETFSQLCYTDIIACSSAAIALAAVACDLRLEQRRTRYIFGIFGAASILAKSVAGFLPFAAMLFYCIIVPKDKRPEAKRIIEAILIAIIVLAPWHIYQIVKHPQWFWADYVQVQLLGVGFKGQSRQFIDAPIFYYLKRMIEMDPFFVVYAIIGLVGFFRIRPLKSHPIFLLAACWTIVTFIALCAFQARNLPYIIFLLPPLCLLGAMGGFRIPNWRVAVICCGSLFFLKISMGDKPWSLYPEAQPIVGAKAMQTYHDMHPGGQLISVDPDDEFYSLTIPLRKIRYCFVDPGGNISKFAPHYVRLGIVLTAKEFTQLPVLLPVYREQLQHWNVNSIEPVGAAITLRAPSDLISVFKAEPDSDFYLPSSWINEISVMRQTHQVVPFSAERVFLLSRTGSNENRSNR